MPKPKKPYRTIKDSYTTGRFTREEIRAAVLAVKAEREAAERAAKAAAAGPKGGSGRGTGASTPGAAA